jgi:hypothetical protein
MPALFFGHAYLLETKMKPPSIICCNFINVLAVDDNVGLDFLVSASAGS